MDTLAKEGSAAALGHRRKTIMTTPAKHSGITMRKGGAEPSDPQPRPELKTGAGIAGTTQGS